MAEEKKDTLIVVSKLKAYIKEQTGMSTSAGVPLVLSDIVRELCSIAIENAKKDGRKTVKDRDFSFFNIKKLTGQSTPESSEGFRTVGNF